MEQHKTYYVGIELQFQKSLNAKKGTKKREFLP